MPDAIETWCPQCGPGVPSDDGGCCGMCGTTCTGPGAEQALDSVKHLVELRAYVALLNQRCSQTVSAAVEQCNEMNDKLVASKDARIAELEGRNAELEAEARAVVAYLRRGAGVEFCLVELMKEK